ncbi:MAG TPA: hypothetical protein VGM97_10435 [Steroidobacteraceae bacterium]|jgi:hypothetical protein
MESLDEVRRDFELRANRSLSLPLAGTAVWVIVAVLGMVLPMRSATLALMFCTGSIFPLAVGIAKVRREELLSNPNQFAKLMGACVFMVNLLWALNIPLVLRAPQFIPLSVGIGLGLHWVVYSWIIRNPLGYIHASFRTAAVLAAWLLFPGHVVTACAAAVVAAYTLTICQMSTRQIVDSELPVTAKA